MENCAFLDITIGPMFSGKTNKLIATYNEMSVNNICYVINHTFDQFKSEKYLCSHSNNKIECNLFSTLDEIEQSDQKNNIQKSQYIFINEAQFFPDLIKWVNLFLSYKKKVYLYGLDADFNGQKFGSMLDLIPIADNVTKLNGECFKCPNKRKSIFSSRIIDSDEVILVGDEQQYVPHCRDCFLAFKLSKGKNKHQINIL